MPLCNIFLWFVTIFLFLHLTLTFQTTVILPITKDRTNQYTVSGSLAKENVTLRVLLDFPGTCVFDSPNPKTLTTLHATDSLALHTYHQTTPVTIHNIYYCADITQRLGTNVTGLAGLGRSNYSLGAQLSTASSSPDKSYYICLPDSSNQGAVIFGSTFLTVFTYTPFLLNPSSDGYFINLTSIEINGKPLPINASILTIDQTGFGETKISTVEPYTVLESSIYKPFVQLFVNESSASNLTVTEAVAPFGKCYSAGDLAAVPTIDLVMDNGARWRISGRNSMVRIKKGGVDVLCLGFVNGGSNMTTAIEIGGYQMEGNLHHFDLSSYRFGFLSSPQDAGCVNLVINLINN